jgi:hypothetical protein
LPSGQDWEEAGLAGSTANGSVHVPRQDVRGLNLKMFKSLGGGDPRMGQMFRFRAPCRPDCFSGE